LFLWFHPLFSQPVTAPKSASYIRDTLFVLEYSPLTQSCRSATKAKDILSFKDNIDGMIIKYDSFVEIFTPSFITDYSHYYSVNIPFEEISPSVCPKVDNSKKIVVVWDKQKMMNLFYTAYQDKTMTQLERLKKSISERMEDEQDKTLTDDEKSAIRDLSTILSSYKIAINCDATLSLRTNDDRYIHDVIQILDQNPQLKLELESYFEDEELSQKSGNNIRNLFIQEGTNPAQIETAIYSFAPEHRTKLGLEDNECGIAIFRIVKR
jgi:hypothetical protein